MMDGVNGIVMGSAYHLKISARGTAMQISRNVEIRNVNQIFLLRSTPTGAAKDNVYQKNNNVIVNVRAGGSKKVNFKLGLGQSLKS